MRSVRLLLKVLAALLAIIILAMAVLIAYPLTRPAPKTVRTVATKKPSMSVTSLARARSTPSTRTLMLPSGILTLWTMLPIVPVS